MYADFKSRVLCAMGIMYNDCHGMADAKGGHLRRVRTRLDSVCGASEAMCQQTVPEHTVGQGRRGWEDEGVQNQGATEQEICRFQKAVRRGPLGLFLWLRVAVAFFEQITQVLRGIQELS